MAKRTLWTCAVLLALSAVTGAPPAVREASPQVAKGATPPAPEGPAAPAAFDSFRVHMKSFFTWNRTLVFQGEGTYTFEMQTLEKAPGEKHMQPSKTPYVTSYRLSPGDLEELLRLLKATEWLSMPASPHPVATDTTEYAMTLSRGQEVARRTYHELDKVQPYVDLTRFLRRIERQEELLYAVTHLGAPSPGNRDLGNELDSLQGGVGRIRPYAPALDYQRLVPAYSEFLANPKLSPRLAADAAKLMGYLRLESQRTNLEALATGQVQADPTYPVPGELRVAAVRALGMMGATQSLAALQKAVQAADRGVYEAVAEVLLATPADQAIPILKDMATKTQGAAWALIQLGRQAEPALHEIFAQPGSENVPGGRAVYHVIRAYVDHWKELPAPPSAATLSAVQDRIRLVQGSGSLSGRYGLDLLKLANDPLAVPNAWQSVEEFLSMMSDRVQAERQKLFLPGHFRNNRPPERFLGDARGGTLRVRAAQVDGTTAWVHVADDKGQVNYTLLLGLLGGVRWTIEVAWSLPAEKVQANRDGFLRAHPDAKPVPAGQGAPVDPSTGRNSQAILQFVGRLMTAFRDKDMATLQRWSAGSALGWITPEEAKDLPAPLPAGLYMRRLEETVKDLHEKYARNVQLMRDIRAVEAEGDWAAVHLTSPRGKLDDQVLVTVVLRRMPGGWRLMDVADARGPLRKDLVQCASALVRLGPELAGRRALRAKEALVAKEAANVASLAPPAAREPSPQTPEGAGTPPTGELHGEEYSVAVKASGAADLARADYEKTYDGHGERSPANKGDPSTPAAQEAFAKVERLFHEALDKAGVTDIGVYTRRRLAGAYRYHGQKDLAAAITKEADELERVVEKLKEQHRLRREGADWPELAALIRLLRQPAGTGQITRSEFADAWDKLGTRADEAVGRVMEEFWPDSVNAYRWRTITALGVLNSAQSRQVLLELALGTREHDGLPWARSAARQYVETLAEKSEAAKLLVSNDAEVLHQAALGLRGVAIDKEMISRLLELTKSPNHQLRRLVVAVLGDDPGGQFAPEKVAAIVQAIPDIAKMDKADDVAWPGSWTNAEVHYRAYIAALAKMGNAAKAVAEELTHARAGELTWRCLVLAKAFGGDANVRPEVRKILSDSEAGLFRAWAAEALGQIGTSDDLPLLRETAEKDPLQREQGGCVSPLNKQLYFPVRQAADKAIKMLQPAPRAGTKAPAIGMPPATQPTNTSTGRNDSRFGGVLAPLVHP